MVDSPQNCLSLRLYMIDGRRHQYLHSQEQAITEVAEHLRRTKVFGQPNLIIQADDALFTFPCSAVARLDIITSRPIPPICTPTWSEAHEITAADFVQRQQELQQQSNGHPRQMIRDERLTLLMGYDLLGGYQVFLEAQRIRSEDDPPVDMTPTDLGIARQHSSHAPISFRGVDGGMSFLNPANIVHTLRFPGGLSRTQNLLMYNGTELREDDAPACE